MKYTIAWRLVTNKPEEWWTHSCASRSELDAKLRLILDMPSLEEVRIHIGT